MPTAKSTIHIQSTPGDVFDLLVDSRRHPDLVHGYVAQDSGPDVLALGDRFRWRMKNFGMTFTTDSVMAAVDRPHRYQERLQMHGIMEGTLTKTLDPVAGGTMLTWQLDYQPTGWLGRLQERVLGSFIAQRGLDESLKLVKEVAERERPQSARAARPAIAPREQLNA